MNGIGTACEACRNNDLETFKSIVPSQVEIEQESLGKSFVFMAIENDSYLILQYLVDLHADIKKTDRAERTPLHYSVIQKKEQSTFILLSAGADPNSPDGEGWTPLHWAVRKHNMKLIQALIEYGSDPTIEDYEGVSPLSLAESCAFQDVVNYIQPFADKIESTQARGFCKLPFFACINRSTLPVSHRSPKV